LSSPALQTKILRRKTAPEEYRVYRAGLEWDLTDPIVIEKREDFKSASRWRDLVEPYHKGLMNELYLDDLREKTHRGLTGRALHGLSTGGRLFGYRTEPRGRDGEQGVAWAIFEPEAVIVRRIFRLYRDGLSMKVIARLLNREGVPFPAQLTQRGPARRGWAGSTIHTILANQKYIGVWVWNKRTFVKDAETGKRTAIMRPRLEWMEERRPDLRTIDDDLWQTVQRRIEMVRAAFGGTSAHKRPRGRAPDQYSRYLLSGLIQCGVCGGRVTIQTSCRRKGNGVTYRYARYRCGFHVTKGPTVCTNTMSIRHDLLEGALLAKFQAALTPEMVDYLVTTVNRALLDHCNQEPRDRQALVEERQRLDRELANLVAFVAEGDTSSPRLREEIRARDRRLFEIDQEMERLGGINSQTPLQVHRAWIENKLRDTRRLLASDNQGARRELQKHIEDLRVTPASDIGQRVIRVTGRGKLDGLLEGEEAVRLQLVAGAGFEPATFGL
jgi:site-specific DNA recombinase